MFLQVLRDPKTLGAQVARERLFTGVKAQVSLEIVFETEGLSAVRTVVRSFSGVKSLVPSQALP